MPPGSSTSSRWTTAPTSLPGGQQDGDDRLVAHPEHAGRRGVLLAGEGGGRRRECQRLDRRRSFTVDTIAPSVPTLVYPANGTVTTDTTPWLDWSDVTDATGVNYQLQVDNNADFSSPVVNKSGLTFRRAP